MKILYAIQGTGNGHLSRARDIIPVLQKNHQIDILISGSQADVELPFPVKYKFKGLGFVFGRKGGIDLVETYRKNHIKVLLSEINSLPVHEYDLVINDFEPVSAWACYLSDTNCVSISHQAAVMHKKAPKPKKSDIIGEAVLKNYAPVKAKYGFHFKAYSENIYTPVIRAQIREQSIENKGHYTVYLPAYDDERIVKVLDACSDTRWEVFSKHNKIPVTTKNISIQPINNTAFIKSLASSAGVICGAGFETPAEALFMCKKLMVIPMKGQYEQQCNAAALEEMGIPILKSLKTKNIEKIIQWTQTGAILKMDYPDNTDAIINQIISAHIGNVQNVPALIENNYSVKKFRKLLLRKIISRY